MPAIAGASRKTPGIFYDKGGGEFNAMHPDFEIVGNGIADDGAKLLAAIAEFHATFPNGGRFCLRGKKIKHTTQIDLPSSLVFMNGSHVDYDFTGTTFLPYITANNQAAIAVSGAPGAPSIEAYTRVIGGFVNGVYATGTGLCGWRISAMNTYLARTCAVECSGAAYDFQWTNAAPPIRCTLDVIALANKKGIRIDPDAFLYPAWSGATNYVIGNVVSSGGVNYMAVANHSNHAPPNTTYWQRYAISVSGLWIARSSWIEHNDEEGLYVDTGGVWTAEGIYENNGEVTPTKPQISVKGSNNFNIHAYLESNLNQPHANIKVEGTSSEVLRGSISRCQITGYDVAGAIGVDFAETGACYNITVEENDFVGMRTGIRIGPFSKGHYIGKNAWSSSFSQGTTWNAATAYVPGTIVNLTGEGTNYVCILANTNQTPPNATYWQPMLTKRVEDNSGTNTGRVTLSDQFTGTDTFKGTMTATDLVATASVKGLTGIFGASDIGGAETVRINGALRLANAILFAASNVAPAANIPGMYRNTATGSVLNIRGGTDSATQIKFRVNDDTVIGQIDNAGAWMLGLADPGGTDRLRVDGGITHKSTTFMRTKVALTDASGAAAGTLTNAPTAGNPTKWITIDDNGTTRKIPTWT